VQTCALPISDEIRLRPCGSGALPMQEPKELADARRRLARAEAEIDTADGLANLQEGLELLESVAVDDAAGQYRAVARTLGTPYAARVYQGIRRDLDSGRNLPEPVLRPAFA